MEKISLNIDIELPVVELTQLYHKNRNQLAAMVLDSSLEDVPHRLITTDAIFAPWEND